MAMADAATRNEIIALEKSYWDAMKAKDGKRTAQLSADDALVTGATGVRVIPKAKMGKMTEDSDWELHSYDFDDVQVTMPAANVAIIAYTVRQSVTMKGKKAQIHAAESSTWIKGKQGWECHAHSETFLSNKQAA
jgi:ketosteroid isomerase-like protein